jgi:hypothetical protein
MRVKKLLHRITVPAAIGLLGTALAGGCRFGAYRHAPVVLPPGAESEFNIRLGAVQEGGFIEPADAWPVPAPGLYEAAQREAGDAWRRVGAAILNQYYPDEVRELSVRAADRMAGYRRIVPAPDAEPAMIRMRPDGRELVFRVPVETLPSSRDGEPRTLVLFLIYDRLDSRLVRAILTIR